MSKKTSLVVFIVVVIILVAGITLWANSRDTSVAPSPTSSGSPLPSASATSTPSVSPSASVVSYTMAQVAQHKTQTDCWSAIDGKVYNLTPFITKHPGGVPNIMKVCGVDGSATFGKKHGGDDKPEAALATLEIGVLAR